MTKEKEAPATKKAPRDREPKPRAEPTRTADWRSFCADGSELC